jgi:hypothetical protein
MVWILKGGHATCGRWSRSKRCALHLTLRPVGTGESTRVRCPSIERPTPLENGSEGESVDLFISADVESVFGRHQGLEMMQTLHNPSTAVEQWLSGISSKAM